MTTQEQSQQADSRNTSIEIWKAIEIVARAEQKTPESIWENGEHKGTVLAIAQSFNPDEELFEWGCETIKAPSMQTWTSAECYAQIISEYIKRHSA